MSVVRRFLLMLMLVVAVFAVEAQQYKVIKIKGSVKVNGKELVQGQNVTINPADKISFSPSNSAAMVFSNSQGLAALYDEETKKTKTVKSIVEGKVQAYFKLSTKTTGTRAGEMVTLLDLQNHFGRDNYLVLGGEIRLKINPRNFPMNDERFFVISYNYEGEAEPINKMLSSDGVMLIINREEIYTIDGKAADHTKVSDFKLSYYKSDTDEMQAVSSFHPVFPDDSELTEEVQGLVDALRAGGKTDEQIKDEVSNYLSATYGKPDKDNLREWMSKHIK